MNNGDMPAMPISADLIRPAQGEALPHAFPYGLTKREYFAGLAMQAIIAHPNGLADQWKKAASHALLAADALLAELDK